MVVRSESPEAAVGPYAVQVFQPAFVVRVPFDVVEQVTGLSRSAAATSTPIAFPIGTR